MMLEKLKLYLVTDDQILEGSDFYSAIEDALKGGVTCLQLRDKTSSDEVFLEKAIKLKALAHQYDALFFVNDRVEIAKQVGADGIHVGQDDLEALKVKDEVGKEMLIGVSTQTVEQSIKAKADGADYIGVGAVFGTATKEDAKLVSKETVQAIMEEVDLPVVLIGGLTLERIKTFEELPIGGYAVVSAILGAPSIYDEAKKWQEALSKSR